MLASQGKRAVASDERCQLFAALYKSLAMQQNLGSSRAFTPAFKSVEGPSVKSLKTRIDRRMSWTVNQCAQC